MKLKEIRQLHHLTQAACAEYLGIPLRTYKRYESDEEKIPPIKRAFIFSKLQELGNTDEDHGVLTTVFGALNYSTNEDAEYINSLGLPYLNYINAGVMVIDCNRFNQMGYFEKAAEIIAERRQFTYIDQDVLNLACNGNIGLVDPSWNLQWNNMNHPERFMPEVRSSVKQIIQPRIVHFTIDKPWKRMLNRFGEFYTKYAVQNPVYNRF